MSKSTHRPTIGRHPPGRFVVLATHKLRLAWVRGLLGLLGALGRGPISAHISTGALAVAIAVEALSEYILWPLRLLLRIVGNEEHPPPLFGGGLGAALIGAVAGAEAGARSLDNVTEFRYRLGLTRGAIASARTNAAHNPSPERAAALLRCLIASEDDRADEYLSAARDNAGHLEEVAGQPDSPPRTPGGPPGRPLRVGIMGDFFCGQIAGQSLRPQLALHDPVWLTPVLYNSGLQSCVDLYPAADYHEVAAFDDEALAALIRSHRIDILIETSGPIRPRNRLGVLARRAAPIQINWYNLPASFGLDTVDYAICDAISLPERHESHLIERPLRLPGGATGGWAIPDDIPPAPSPVTATGQFTFGCFGDSFKLNARVLDAWANILHGVPGSRLYLKNSALGRPMGRLWFAFAFARRGVPPARLRLEGFSSYEDMRRLYAHVDLALDTFPYSGGSTTINALWQGVPVLAIAGPDWRGRTSASILASAGLEHLACPTPEAYVRTAMELARDPAMTAELRAGMRARLKERSAYFNLDAYARDFERALADIWRESEKR